MTGRLPTGLRGLSLWGPPIVWMGLIYHLSSHPLPAATPSAPDWLMHGIAYGVLAALLFRAAAGGSWTGGAVPPARWLAVFAIAALYGVSDEWHQSRVPGRTPEVRDVAADAAGAAFVRGALVLIRMGVVGPGRSRRGA